ncbi:MAG: hypothetical protein JXA82_02460 [Sedimentisphaerales bacterium]|nr:hypothetical protein [Sedimentisphaerales bacterium]
MELDDGELLSEEPEQAEPKMTFEEEVLSEVENQKVQKRSWQKNLVILGISLIIFFQMGLLDNGLPDVILLIGVLFLHEMGHAAGMRLFGYRNVQMFFIPMFGAAVQGRSTDVGGGKKALVSLLGPGPGILLGAILLVVYGWTQQEWVLHTATILLLINLFNLLPFFPLDGGRFFNEVLFSRNRYLEAAFRAIASVILILIGLGLGMWFLALFGFFSLTSVRFSFRIAGIARDLKQPPVPDASAFEQLLAENKGPEQETETVSVYKTIYDKVREQFPAIASTKILASHVTDVYDRMRARPPRILATIGLLGLYLSIWLLPIFGLVGSWVTAAAGRERFIERKIVAKDDGQGGQVLVEQVYWNGILEKESGLTADGQWYHGRSVSYFPNGKISRESQWVQGKIQGEAKVYNINGEPFSVTVFEEGKFISYREMRNEQWIDVPFEELLPLRQKMIRDNEQGNPHGPKTRSGQTIQY